MSLAAAILGRAKDLAKGLQRRFEGWRAKPYLCPAGVPTIAYGATQYEDGRKVTLKDPAVSKARGEALLDHDSELFLRAAAALSPILTASPERLAAIGDFCFNLGTTRYKASTLKRKVDAGEWDEAIEQLGKWVFGGGRKLPGLVARRAAEAEIMRQAGARAANDDVALTRDDLIALLEAAQGAPDPLAALLTALKARVAA